MGHYFAIQIIESTSPETFPNGETWNAVKHVKHIYNKYDLNYQSVHREIFEIGDDYLSPNVKIKSFVVL